MTRNDTNPVRKPLPAHDTERSVALPWRRPKAEQEDAAAPELVATITAHPTYIEADRDGVTAYYRPFASAPPSTARMAPVTNPASPEAR